jgi:divinyl protochlorophyllide a 8-vinyl-reductase
MHAPAAAVGGEVLVGRIGPNAIVQVGVALSEAVGHAGAARLFDAAGLHGLLASPPVAMVDERDVVRLHAAIRAGLVADVATAVAADAGRRTGDYLLAHRIPRAAQRILRLLPRGVAARTLLAAIARHSWTFAGSGAFSYRLADPRADGRITVQIEGCPLCRDASADVPQCAFYAATFERLFRALVAPGTVVTEIRCEATGGEACVFLVAW